MARASTRVSNFIARVKNLFTGRPQFLVNPQAPIKEAFISNGVTYYQFEDIFSMPCERAFEATTFYEEMKSRISKEYLTEYLDAMTMELSNPKGINMQQVVLLTNTLKQRSELIVDSDIIFKLAAVMYFDKNESPYSFDMKYNAKKIEGWKQSDDVASFFLSTPIRDLLPFTDISESDLNNYLRVTEEVKKEHQRIISQSKSLHQRR